DPAQQKVVASTSVASNPDYVRYVSTTAEAWVTEPSSGRIEVFSIPSTGTPAPAHAAFIDVSGGPEGLTIDDARQRAYVHLFGGEVAAIDLNARAVVATWPTGCSSSHGIPALDDDAGLLFAGCSSAEIVALDVEHDGAVVADYKLGKG